MILLNDILNIHQFSIDKYGGGSGIRDIGSLESAIARLFQTFDGNELYPTVFEKVAALGESLIINHPFVDGNKRTGFLAIGTFLKEENYMLTATQEEAYDFTIQISNSEIRFEEIIIWLKQHTKAI